MMKAAMPLLLLSLLVSAVPAVHVRQLEAAAAAPHVQRVQMALANYVGDIHGARALAAIRSHNQDLAPSWNTSMSLRHRMPRYP